MILIAKSEIVGALRNRLGADPSAHIFADTDSLIALDVIVSMRPKVVGLDPSFATTSRGAALIARVKADPELAGVDLRILVEDETHLPVLLGQQAVSADVAMATGSRPLDRCGTRRAPRFRVRADTTTLVNGEPSRLVNLSATGAQVLTPIRLQPNQAIRMVLLAEGGDLRIRANVAWSSLEVASNGLKYRAGAEFVDPDAQWIDAYCTRCATTLEHAFLPS